MMGHVLRCMSPELARSCGPVMSALSPLSEDKQTSREQVENDAIDPDQKSPLVRQRPYML